MTLLGTILPERRQDVAMTPTSGGADSWTPITTIEITTLNLTRKLWAPDEGQVVAPVTEAEFMEHFFLSATPADDHKARYLQFIGSDGLIHIYIIQERLWQDGIMTLTITDPRAWLYTTPGPLAAIKNYTVTSTTGKEERPVQWQAKKYHEIAGAICRYASDASEVTALGGGTSNKSRPNFLRLPVHYDAGWTAAGGEYARGYRGFTQAAGEVPSNDITMDWPGYSPAGEQLDQLHGYSQSWAVACIPMPGDIGPYWRWCLKKIEALNIMASSSLGLSSYAIKSDPTRTDGLASIGNFARYPNGSQPGRAGYKNAWLAVAESGAEDRTRTTTGTRRLKNGKTANVTRTTTSINAIISQATKTAAENPINFIDVDIDFDALGVHPEPGVALKVMLDSGVILVATVTEIESVYDANFGGWDSGGRKEIIRTRVIKRSKKK